MLTFNFVCVEKHAHWSREWNHSIKTEFINDSHEIVFSVFVLIILASLTLKQKCFSVLWDGPVRKWNAPVLRIGHFRDHNSLHFKERLSAKSLLWKSVFIRIEIIITTRRLKALTWDALVDEWVHIVTLVIRGQQKFNVDSVQHDKRSFFSLLEEALNTGKEPLLAGKWYLYYVNK